MITIDTKDRRPIYEQLIESVKKLVMDGTLAPDEQLPSVRQLASTLAINPNTIQKAFSLLERDGIIYSLGGRGSFISTDTAPLRERKTNEALAALTGAVKVAHDCGVKKTTILRQIDDIYEKGGSTANDQPN